MSLRRENDAPRTDLRMELMSKTSLALLEHAFDQMLVVAEVLGEPRIHQRPLGPTTNAVGALIVHCCEVTEFWLGHVALRRPSDRDREAEFSAVESLDDLHRPTGRDVRFYCFAGPRMDCGRSWRRRERRTRVPARN